MSLVSTNPSNGRTLRAFEELTDAELDARIGRAGNAFQRYRRTSPGDRAARLQRAAGILQAEKRELGRLMTREMGKPIAAAVAEVEKCAWACRYYAEHGARFLADEPVDTGRPRSLIRYQPLGPVLAIMPWNFPFWQVFRFAAPALMAGNTGLLKHASNVPQCALAIEDVLRRAGFAGDEFQTLLIGSSRVAGVLADARVRAVTLTGSETAGRSVAQHAGRHLKKTVLELGGSDAFVVLPSADLERAVATAVAARVINNGQSCIAAKRFIVHEAIADPFEQAFVERMRALRIGDPLDAQTELGPLATAHIRAGLHDQVQRAVQLGARVLTGGQPLDRPGFFYAPTVLTDVRPGSPAYEEELFGPVAALFRAASLDDAIRIANDTTFGLGSCAWTNEPEEQERFCNDVEAGIVFINGMVASDPRLPFGGVKNSGYGRELGMVGMREFVNVKTIVVQNGVATNGAASE